jgi:hypothetical protein
MGILLALVLILTPGEVESQPFSARITISPDLAETLPPIDALESGLQRHFERVYGRFVDIAFDAAPAPGGGETAVVALALGQNAITVSTDLTRGTWTRSLVSTVPQGATVSLLSTIAADIAFLHFTLVGLAAFPLSPPPPMAATVLTDTLSGLTSWGPAELEPIGLAPVDDGVVVCFPHRFLTLGPFFTITDRTVRDINQQATDREPVQISAVAVGAGGEIILVSGQEGSIVRLNPRLGTRQVLTARGISARGARMLGTGSLAVLANTPGAVGLDVFPFSGQEPRLVPIHAVYVSAFSRDSEGNFWAWDAGERRVRVVTPGGREVYSIRPLIGASTMQLPQQLEVFDDGSFLLGGSGEVWKFQNNGIPLWRLTRVPGRPSEQLPSSFALAANASDGSFFLLDAPSRRLLMFAPSPAEATAGFVQALSRMDARSASDLRNAAGLARQAGFSLMAWQLGDMLARRGGPPIDREAGQVAVLRERSALYADFADSLARDLLFDRADAAYARAAESARALADRAPTDQDAARLLQRVLASRLEMRAGFTRRPDIRIVSAAGEIRRREACGASLVVKIGILNTGTTVLRSLRAHVSAPPVSASPSLSSLDSLAPGQERELEVPLDLSPDQSGSALPGKDLHTAVLVTYQRGVEGVSVRTVLDVPVTSNGPQPTAADLLACRVAPGDQLVAGLADDLLTGPIPAVRPSDAAVALAAILDTLGRLRGTAARAAAFAGADPADASSGPGGTELPADVRETLRTLSPDERGWTLLTLCTAASLGLQVGLVSWQDRAFALVDTGIAPASAVSEVPGLGRYSAVLDALARGDTLCVPLSGRMPADAVRRVIGADTEGAAGWALVDALRDCAKRDLGKARIWWRGASSAAEVPRPLPAAFPFPLPAIRVAPSRDTLRAEITQSLEQQK